MDLPSALLIVGVGVLSGALNVIAGGGSLLVLPVLLEMGFAGPVANGTVRIGVLTQNLAAMVGFQRGGEPVNTRTGWLVAAALPGAALGAFLGVRLEGAAFRYVLAAVMAGVWLWMAAGWIGARRSPDAPDDNDPADAVAAPTRPTVRALLLMVGVGLYGGFIQAGVGFLLMAVVNRAVGEGLVRTNAHKVWIVAAYTVVAIGIFASRGAIDWSAGLILAAGTTVGGALGARLTLRRGAGLIRVVFSIALVALLIRMLFF